jgi:hypothetical protein
MIKLDHDGGGYIVASSIMVNLKNIHFCSEVAHSGKHYKTSLNCMERRNTSGPVGSKQNQLKYFYDFDLKILD